MLVSIAATVLCASAPCQGMAMVYYGSDATDFARIAANPPQILVPGDIPTLAAQASLLHPSGITLLAYIPTGWAGTNGAYGALANVETQVDQAMDAGADGILFDEASSDATPGTSEGGYYAALFQYVKANYGAEKTVAINPGVGNPDVTCFGVADIVCLECEWASFQAGSYPGIAPDRVWGLDSTSDCGNLDGGVGQAVLDRSTANADGVGYFYATSEYIALPPWYEQLVQTPGVCATAAADGGVLDAGPPDAGGFDAGQSDAGARDAGSPPDGGLRDAGAADAGRTADAGTNGPAIDGGPPDGGRELESGDGGAPVAVAVAGCGCSGGASQGPCAVVLCLALLARISHRRGVNGAEA